MKKIKIIVFCFLLGMIYSKGLSARTDSTAVKYSKIYIGVTFDLVRASGLPGDIYQPWQGIGFLWHNTSFGLHFERTFSKRLATITGINMGDYRFPFDGEPETDNITNQLIIKKAGDNKRYPEIVQNYISVPLQLRYYFSDNFRSKKNYYVQAGAKVGYNYWSRYRYRENKELISEELDALNTFTYGPELVFGYKSGKGNFETFIDNLSFSVYYQMSSFTKDGLSSEIRPIVGSLRWGF